MFEFNLTKRLLLFVFILALALSAVACTRDKPVETPVTTPVAIFLTTPEAPTPVVLATPLPTSPIVLPTFAPQPTFAPVIISPTVVLPNPAPLNTPLPTAILPAPTITPTVASSAGPATGATTYIVQQGEWLYSIARKLGISPQAVQAANPGMNPNWLVPGQVINLPGAGTSTSSAATGKTHTVKAGETLYSIAVQYGTTPYAIQLKNNLANPNFIYPGQTLLIP